MEKTAQTTTSGAPRRRRRRRGSGSGASQAAPAQNTVAKESQKPAPKATRQQAPRKEGNKESGNREAPARNRHRGGQSAEQAAPAQGSGRRNRTNAPAPAKENAHAPKQSTRAARAPRKPVEEDPGLELITRRPPKQKFANFEEYLAAHGGMTVPLPEEPAPAAETVPAAAEPAVEAVP